MRWRTAPIFLALLAILGVPFALRSHDAPRPDPNQRKLVVLTPHVLQIRNEFARAFDAWHRRRFGEGAAIDWRQPGGTSEIVKQLQAVYAAELASIIQKLQRADPARLAQPDLRLADEFTPGSMPFDMVFGGGSYDHTRLKRASNVSLWFRPFPKDGFAKVQLAEPSPKPSPDAPPPATLTCRVTGEFGTLRLRFPTSALRRGADTLATLARGAPDADAELDLSRAEREASVSVSAPAGFDQPQLDEWFGPANRVGSEFLYDPPDPDRNDPGQFWLGTALSSFGIVYNKDLYQRLALPEPASFEDLARPQLLGLVAMSDPRQSGSVATTLDSILSNYGWDKGWRVLREISANTRYFTNSAPKPPIDVSQGEAAAGLAIDFYGRGQGQSVLAPGQDPSSTRVGYVDPPGTVYIDADPISILRGSREPELARRFIEFILSEEGQALWQFPARDRPAGATNPTTPDATPMGPQHEQLRRMPVRPLMYDKYLTRFIDRVNPFELASKTRPKGWRPALSVLFPSFSIDIADEQRAAWAALLRARAAPAFPPGALARMEELFYAFPAHRMPDGTQLPLNEENFKPIADSWRDKEFAAACSVRYTAFFRENYRRIVAIEKRPAAHAGPPAGR